MYRHITSNKSPYKKITYYTSYGDKVAHVHKNSEAYKFFTSSIYKNAIKVGKFTNVVMPIVSNILTSYVVYKRFITKTPNKYNSNDVIIKVDNKKYRINAKLYDELCSSGKKFNSREILMITKTPKGKLVWLEKGNSKAGLVHITQNHKCDFTKRGITDIPKFLKSIMETSPISTNRNSMGYSAVYLVKGKEYIVAYGTNGFIVSAYPKH